MSPTRSLDIPNDKPTPDVVTLAAQFQPGGLKLQTKAGTPTDADVIGAVVDGIVIFDTTAKKIWIRAAGVWVATAALA